MATIGLGVLGCTTALLAQAAGPTSAKDDPSAAAAVSSASVAAVEGIYDHRMSNGISLVVSFRPDSTGELSVILPEQTGIHAKFAWRMGSPTVVELKFGNEAVIRAFDHTEGQIVARVELMHLITPGMRFEKRADANTQAPVRATMPAPLPGASTIEAAEIECVLQRYHEVSGRAAAEKQVQSRVWSVSFEGQNMGGQIITHEKAPDLCVRVMTLGGIGAMAEGFDGTTAWKWSTHHGFRKLQGEEAAALRAAGQFHKRLDTRATQRRWLGRDTLDGRAVEKIELVVDGEARVESFDVETGLLVRSELGGKAVTFSDFRRVGPEQIPHVETSSDGFTLKVHRVQENVAIADGHFVPRRGGIPSWMPDNKFSTGMAMKERFHEAVYWLVNRSQPDPILRMLPYGMVEQMGGREAAAKRLKQEYGPALHTTAGVEFHEEGGRVWAVFLVSYNELKGQNELAKDLQRLSMIVFSDSSQNWRFVPAWLLRDMKTRQVLPAIPIKVEDMLDACIREKILNQWP